MSLQQHEFYRFDEFVLDRLKRTLMRSGEPVTLSPKAFDVLSCLVMNPGRVVAKDEILKSVWPESFVEESNLTQHISALRKAFADRAGYIVTVPGQGYQFTARVQSEEPPLPPVQAGVLVQTVRERARLMLEQAEGAEPLPALPAPAKRLHWLTLAASLALVVGLAGFAGWRITRPKPTSVTAVLADVINDTGDPDFDRTLKRAMEIELQQSPYMDVMTERVSADTLQLMGKPTETPITADIAREICERANRQVLLTGNISILGNHYLVTLAGSNCRTGETVAAAKAEAATKDAVLQAVDAVAGRVRKGLNESSSSLAKYDVPLREATTPSLEALRQYSLGKYFETQGRYEEAKASYLQATQLDPQFALAYNGLGACDTFFGQEEQAASEFAQAFRLSDHVSAFEQLKIRGTYLEKSQRNVVESIKYYELLATTYPRDTVGLVDETDAYIMLGEWQAAREAGERSIRQFPNAPLGYENLGFIYRSLNRFEDAKAATLRAAQVSSGDTGLHIALFEIAMSQRDDAAIEKEAAWLDAHDDGAALLNSPALLGSAAAAQGRYHEAERLYRRDYDNALRANLPETANIILLDQARTEWNLGYPAAARATLARLSHWKTDLPDLAELQAEVSNGTLAAAYLAAHGGTFPDTLMTYVYVPRVRAVMALLHHAEQDAIQALEPSRPYEMRDYTVPSLRAAAYAAFGQGDLAIAEYRKITENPGIAPESVLYPMAHLELARAYAVTGKSAQAREEYESLFQLWKNADPDLAVLKQARAEYARLPGGGTKRL